MGVPVDPGRTRLARLLIDRLDQRPADAFPPRLDGREQVLQVAAGRDRRGAAVEEVVGQAQQAPVLLGDQGVDRFMGVEEPRPGRGGDRRVEVRLALAAVEGVLAVPQGKPLGVVFAGDRADGEGHDGEAAT